MLQNLECLELQKNALTTLPAGLSELTRLRILNIAENRFASLPFEVLTHLPLAELLAAKNKLAGVLILQDIGKLPHLQILDVTANSLTQLTPHYLELPSLQQLICSANRLTVLPDMTTWQALITLTAEGNSISSIPEGLVTLPKLRSVDFTGNNIKALDDRLGAMDTLAVLRVSGNPLREKKFASMATDDLKRALKARLEPEEQVEDVMTEDEFFDSTSMQSQSHSATSEWPVKTGGVLDRSGTKSSTLDTDLFAQAASNDVIRSLQLHHNNFQSIPTAINSIASTLTVLSLAHNEITSDNFMKSDLELPVLKELNLSANRLSLINPLIHGIRAPNLEKLDISFNRLTSLSSLKPYFPKLMALHVANNNISELPLEAVRGLKILDCSSNEIGTLNPRIGLLGGPEGLQRLDVSGNRFRVPKYTILEKGTEATLAWLRDRIPENEMDVGDVD